MSRIGDLCAACFSPFRSMFGGANTQNKTIEIMDRSNYPKKGGKFFSKLKNLNEKQVEVLKSFLKDKMDGDVDEIISSKEKFNEAIGKLVDNPSCQLICHNYIL